MNNNYIRDLCKSRKPRKFEFLGIIDTLRVVVSVLWQTFSMLSTSDKDAVLKF